MVLQYSGRVGSRQPLFKARSIKFERAFFVSLQFYGIIISCFFRSISIKRSCVENKSLQPSSSFYFQRLSYIILGDLIINLFGEKLS